MSTTCAQSHKHSSNSHSERRRETRQPVGGDVILTFQDPQPIEILGRLIDLSVGGFRVAHKSPALRPGQLVKFRHAWSAGEARVMWNRVTSEGKMESGLFVLQV
jgi:hypothetical protein